VSEEADMREIRVAIVGCGRISTLHAAVYTGGKAGEGAVLAAACDADTGLAERRAAEWGARAASFEGILADPSIEAVEILTPTSIHEEPVVRALKAGKHVSVQKPMTTSLASADRMIRAARASGRILKVAENYAHYPPILLARRLIDSGAIGDPMVVRIKMISGGSGGWAVPDSAWAWRLRERFCGRGMNTFDHGHHMYATAWSLLGPIEKVEAWIDEVGGVVDSPALVMWKHRGERRYGQCEFHYGADLELPSRYYANDEWIDVSGSRGLLRVARCTASVCEGPAVSLYSGGQWRDYEAESDWAAGFEGSTRNFIASIRGEEAARPSAEEARHLLAVDLAVSKADRIGRAVWVDELDSPFPPLYALSRRRRERRAKAAFIASLAGAAEGRASGARARELTLALGSRFRPEAAAGFEADIGLLLDPGEAAESSFAISVRGGAVSIREAALPEPALFTLRASSATWAGMLLGTTRIEGAYLRGKLRVEGEIAQALKLRAIFGL
jgi:predicted dehydrogenase/putative sterol carrier protein